MILSDLSPRFQGHDIIQRQITQKKYKIELYLSVCQHVTSIATSLAVLNRFWFCVFYLIALPNGHTASTQIVLITINM